MLHLVMREENAERVFDVFERGPEARLMRVAIAGAGAVGRSIARELIENGHKVLLIDKEPRGDPPRAGRRTPSGCWPTPASCPPWRRRGWRPATS